MQERAKAEADRAALQGAYVFQGAEGRPLRVQLDKDGAPAKDAEGNFLLDPEGVRPVREVAYPGTGFLVDRSGLVLTNRHVAEPWWNDDEARSLAERGFKPRLTTLRAFFPLARFSGNSFAVPIIRHTLPLVTQARKASRQNSKPRPIRSE